MSNTIKIAVGKNPVAQSKRAVSISKSGLSGKYDSLRWTTSDAGTLTIDFDSASYSPSSKSQYRVSQGSPADLVLKGNAPLHTAFKYEIKDSDGNTVDDPYVIIEL